MYGISLDLLKMVVERYQILVGGFNPFEKYERQNGSLPHLGVINKRKMETTS